MTKYSSHVALKQQLKISADVIFHNSDVTKTTIM